MAKPIIDYPLPIEHGMHSNTSRYLRGGGVRELHNMMFDPTEVGVIRNTPGVKLAFTTFHPNTYTPDSAEIYSDVRGVNSIAILSRGQDQANDNILVGAKHNKGGVINQDFHQMTEPAVTVSVSPPVSFQDLKGDVAICQIRNNESDTIPYSAFVFDDQGWKSGGQEENDFSAGNDPAQYLPQVTITLDSESSVAGTLAFNNTTKVMTYSSTTNGTTHAMTLTITSDNSGLTASQKINFEVDSGADILLRRNFYMVNSIRQHAYADWTSATNSASKLPIKVWHPITSSQLNQETPGKVITVAGTTTGEFAITNGSTEGSIYFQSVRATSLAYEGDVYTASVSDSLDNYTTTIIFYVVPTPYPSTLVATKRHSIVDNDLSLSYNPPYGVWRHAVINKYAYFMSGITDGPPFAVNIDDPSDVLTTSTLPLTRADIRPDDGDATVLQVYVGDQGGQSGKGGSNYTAGDLIFTGGDPATSSATGTYSVDSGGAITATALTASGAGYVTTPVVTGDVGGADAVLTPFMSSYMRATASTAGAEEDRNVIGFVKYALSWLDALDAEGPISEFYVGTQAGTGSTVSVINIPVGPAGKARLYRTYANREQFFFLEQIEDTPNAITASYVDELPDLELGDKIWTHGDAIPANAFSPVAYYDRLWCLAGEKGSRLYWSDINEPRSWWLDGNWANIYADDGDQGVALVRAHDGILIFKQDHLYKFKGRSPQDAILTEVTLAGAGDMSLGTPSPNAIASTVDGIFFFWRGSIYRYFDEKVSVISGPIADRFDDIPRTNWRHVMLGYHPEKRLLFVSASKFAIEAADDSTIDKLGATYIYSTDSESWLGKMQGFYGPFSNVTFHTQDDQAVNSGFDRGKRYASHFVAGDHNSKYTTAAGTTAFSKETPPANSVVRFDYNDSLWGGDAALFNPVADATPNAGSAAYSPAVRYIRYHTTRGYPRHRNILKRYMYVDVPCTADADISHVQLGVRIDGGAEVFLTPTITRVSDDSEEVQVIRFSLGYVGKAISIRTYMATSNREDIKFYGPSLGYQLMGRSGTTGWSRTGGLRA